MLEVRSNSNILNCWVSIQQSVSEQLLQAKLQDRSCKQFEVVKKPQESIPLNRLHQYADDQIDKTSASDLVQSQSSINGLSSTSLSDCGYEKATITTIEDFKHQDSRAFKPRLYKAIQPSYLEDDLLPPSQTDLSAEERDPQHQLSSVSQTSQESHNLMPEFAINIDTESSYSRLPSIDANSTQLLEDDMNRHKRVPIDTNIDIVSHLEKNLKLLEFHRERSAGSPSNQSSCTKSSQKGFAQHLDKKS